MRKRHGEQKRQRSIYLTDAKYEEFMSESAQRDLSFSDWMMLAGEAFVEKQRTFRVKSGRAKEAAAEETWPSGWPKRLTCPSCWACGHDPYEKHFGLDPKARESDMKDAALSPSCQ